MARTSLFAKIGSLVEEMVEQSPASAKRAYTDDPGSMGGKSTHETAKGDEDNQAASTGAPAAENAAYQKEHNSQGPDSTPEAKPGDVDQDAAQKSHGTNQASVGNDPAVERDYKETKEDPGTSHPAKAAKLTLKQAAVKALELANGLLADVAMGATGTVSAPQKSAQTAATKSAQTQVDEFRAGYELAAKLGISKQAAENSVRDFIYDTIVEASADADRVIAYVSARTKQAMDEMASGEDHSEPEDDESGKGDAGGGEAAVGGDPLAAAGGGGGGAGDGDPLAALMGGGGDPAAAGGMPPMGADPMGGGGGGDPHARIEQLLQELSAAIAELDMPLGDLAQLPDQAPPGMDPAATGPKIAAAVHAFRRSGRYQIKAAASKQARQLRDQLKAHIIELVARSK